MDTINHFTTLMGWGGVERLLLDFLMFERSSFRHTITTTSSKKYIVEEYEKINIPWYEPSCKFRYNPYKFVLMANWLDRNSVKLIHSYDSHANVWAYFTKKFYKGCKQITSERGSLRATDPILGYFNQIAHLYSDLIITNSNASKELLTSLYKLPNDKIIVVNNAVPNFPLHNKKELRQKLGIPSDKFVVGSIGRLAPEKDFGTIIKTAHYLRRIDKQVCFLIIGGGPMANELINLINDLNISEVVKITGWRSDARDVLQACDLYINTSIREAFGNALVEAALCSLPVIAPAIDGIPEVVEHNHTGLLITPTDPVNKYKSKDFLYHNYVIIDGRLSQVRSLNPEKLGNAILFFKNSKEVLQTMGSNAYNNAIQKFSMQRYINDMLKIYTNCL